MSLTRTVTPSVEELLEKDSLVNGDMGAAWDEMIERIDERLNLLIVAENTRKGWSGGLAMARVEKVQIAPTDITKLHKNLALVAMEETTDHMGIGGAFINLWQATVWVVGDLTVTPQQVRTLTRRGEMVKTLLYPYLSGCTNANNSQVWRECVPTNLSLMHDMDEKISAAVATFSLKQPPR